MKLHFGVDAATGEIAAHVLTDGHADDAAQVPDLLRTVEGTIASLTADGAYDGHPVYRAAAARQSGRPPDVVIPPRASAVQSSVDPNRQSQRDRHIQLITEHGRLQAASQPVPPGDRFAMEWQRQTGYGRRALAETAVGRYKHLIGPKLRARCRPAQHGEVALAIQVLNRMTRTAKPVSVRR